MKHMLFWKGLAIAGLALMLLVPLMMVEGLISSRSCRKREVETNIAESAAGRQFVRGPLLVLDYQELISEWAKDEKGELLNDSRTKKPFQRSSWEDQTRVIAPRSLEMNGDARVEERHRGLYKAQLFHLNTNLKGCFELSADQIPARTNTIAPGRVKLVLGITDLRGVQNRPQLQWQSQTHDFQPGTACQSIGRGLVVDLGPIANLKPGRFEFEVPALHLLGSQELSIAPVGEDNEMRLRSDWANPSFSGRFLPTRSQIIDKGPGKGFEAHWQISSLARNFDAILGSDTPKEVFTVSFVEPVNVYLQSERAVKYGFLFVGLVFAGFFLFEMLKRLPIHPMQYFLVGLSLALFFLLLISLSEHMAFLSAYAVASGASILLLGVYLVGVLKGWRTSLAFSGGLTLLYSVLYGLLASEDNALLMGSLLLFASLAGIMMATRKLDWYNLSGRKNAEE